MGNFIHYYEYALGIDIDKLGKAYFDIRKHLSFNTDDKSKIDFNAICVNRKQVTKILLQAEILEAYIGLNLIQTTTNNND